MNETQLGTVTESYTYTTNADGSTGNLPASYSVVYVQGNVQNRITYAYTYDANGNILSVIETLKEKIGSANETQVYRYTTSYTYDEAGQLRSATDGKTGLTYQYQYDNSGNRTSQTVTASGQSAPQLSETFSYTNGILSGVAKSENGVLENVTYTSDRMGSILTRTVGSTTQTFTWGEGRMLLGVSVDASNNATYTYDASGLRRQKVVTTNGQTVTTDFIWGSNGLVGFKRGNTTVTILYDVEGQPVGFTANDAVYTYVKNIQGDVLKVLDSAGNTVVSYSYDPWGVPTITGNTALAAYNPCSYRGYYYDFETGLYYLQSRYYDPELGRFLNADEPAYMGMSGTLPSLNLFVYCTNNSINSIDSNGYAAINVVCAAIGAIVGWPFGDWIAKQFGYSSGWQYWTIRMGVVVGGAVIGWFAGTLMVRYVVNYLKTNPTVVLSLYGKYGATYIQSIFQFLGINPFSLMKNSGMFIGLARALNSTAVVLPHSWAVGLYEYAKKLGISIVLHDPQGEYTYHIHLFINGKKISGIHLQILKSTWDYLWKLLNG